MGVWGTVGSMATARPETKLDSRYSSLDATATGWEQARELLARAELYWISTVRPDGRPHVTPLIAVWLDGALYFSTGEEERKARNLAANPHVEGPGLERRLRAALDEAQLIDDTVDRVRGQPERLEMRQRGMDPGVVEAGLGLADAARQGPGHGRVAHVALQRQHPLGAAARRHVLRPRSRPVIRGAPRTISHVPQDAFCGASVPRSVPAVLDRLDDPRLRGAEQGGCGRA